MRRLVLILLLVLPLPLLAQSEDDRSYVTGLIEDAVSGLGREVRLIGFRGALSSRATIDQITIADDEGVWLRAEGVGMQWSRTALLRGNLNIEELSAERIELIRVPVPVDEGSTLEAAEAKPFALPDLPVSVNIGEVRADVIELAPDFLGEPLSARFEGSATLSGGAGDAELRLERVDGKEGRFVVDLAYSNATRQLAIDLLAEEGEGGIAARLIGLPGNPSARLTVTGDAPLDDFSAVIALGTAGEDRLTGDVTLRTQPVAATDDGTLPADPDRDFALELSGDIRPLLEPQYHRFFGQRTRLAVDGTAHGDGRLTLSALTLGADQLVLRGRGALAADGWPERFDLRGRLASGTGAPVRLPITGDPISVQAVALDLSYEEAEGDRWEGRFDIDGFSRPGLEIGKLFLEGGGQIIAADPDQRGRFSAILDYAAEGMALEDAALTEALGEDIRGEINFGRVEDEPLVLNRLTVRGAGIALRGSGLIEGPDERFRTRGNLRVEAEDFARFSALAGQPLGGSGMIALTGRARPFDGVFDLFLSSSVRDLTVDVARLDPLLRGNANLSLVINRDEEGTRLRNLSLRGEDLSADASADITARGVQADIRASVEDLALVDPGLSGPGTLRADIRTDTQDVIRLDARLDAPAAALTTRVTATPKPGNNYSLDGNAQLSAQNLAAYAGLVGQRLSGAADISVEGQVETDTGTATADLAMTTRELRAGPAGIDPLLRGEGRVEASFSRTETGRIRLDGLRVAYPNLTATGDVSLSAEGLGRAALDLRLADIGLFTSDFSGPLTAQVTADQDTAGWQVNGNATGPAGTAAQVSGRVANGGSLALSIAGDAPLALANTFIAPRQISGLARFNLSLNGPAALGSLSGPVTISDARLSDPTLTQAVEDVTGTVTLGGGSARLDLAGRIAAGGQIALEGPIGLAAPFNSDLSSRITSAVLREPALYQTTADGAIRVSGPLAGGATIAGSVNLGPTEVQVPSSTASALGELPLVTHLGPRADVRRTLDRAGLDVTPTRRGGGAGRRPFGLDIVINAPSRIFIRGRGLDAELGGTLRIGGTTADVIPEGQFSLIRGRLDLLGQRFDLTEGFAQISGDFLPFLRLVATTRARSGTEVSIIVEGPANAPEVRFESNPQLPEDEVLSQLLFGRDLSSISPLQAVQLASAVATLSGRGGGGVLNDVRQGLNLDDFDLTTDEGGNVAVRAGKYLSDNVYTDVTIGADGRADINLNLDLTDDVTVRGSVLNDGETRLGVFYERDY